GADFQVLATADNAQREFDAGSGLGDPAHRRMRVFHRTPVQALHDVAGLNAGLVGGTAAQYAGDQHAAAVLDVKTFRQLRRQVLRLDAQPAAFHVAALDYLGHDIGREVHGNGETDTLGTARAAVDSGVDTDQLAVGIDQCAAGVARVDGRIGLHKILV